MLSLPSKLLLALAGLATVAAVGYNIAIGERAGVILLLGVALAALATGLAIFGTGVRDMAPLVPADAPPPERAATTPGPAAAGSFGPLGAALALGVLVLGIVVGRALIYIALILSVLAAFGWFARSWSDHPVSTWRMRSRVSNRLVAPILTPLGTFVLAITIAISVSRVLLAVNDKVAPLIALVVAVVILTAMFVIASRPRLRSTAITGLGALAVVSMLGAGVAGASQGERKFERKGEPQPGAQVIAKGTAFKEAQLKVPADKQVAITFKNEDPKAIYHNVAVYDDSGSRPVPIFNGQGIPGGRKITYRTTFKAGTYRFQCDFHANMKGEFVVS